MGTADVDMKRRSFSLECSPGTLRITIAAPRDPEVVRSLRRWIPFWAVIGLLSTGLFYLLLSLFSLLEGEGADCMRVMVTLAMVGLLIDVLYSIGLAVYLLLRHVVGRETIGITSRGIQIRSELLGIGRTVWYAAQDIANLHVAEVRPAWFAFTVPGRPRYFSVPRTGPIAFEYRGRRIRAGFGIDPERAEDIVAAIQQHFPQYKR